MLHVPQEALRTATDDVDRLARRFLKLLMDKVEQPRKPFDTIEQNGELELDALDLEFGIDPNSLPVERAMPRAELCVIAVMLAREIEAATGLLAQLRHRSPMLTLKINNQSDVELVVEVLKQTVFEGRFGDTNPHRTERRGGFVIFGSSTLTPSRILPWFVRARFEQSPVILVSSAPAVEAAELLRTFSWNLTLPAIDNSCLNLVVETMCGEASDLDLDPKILANITYADCAFAIVEGRTPTECRSILIAEVERRLKPKETGPKLEQLAGYGAAKVWGLEVVEDLRSYLDGHLSWDDFPNRAALLCGAPGTGKTTFASALARSAGVPLIASSVADWNAASNLSGTLSAMRSTFQTARAAAPCVLLIDELDGISQRSRLSGQNVEYWQQIVNLLLELLDGSERNDGVVIIGATNYPDMIDPALLRSGRIDRRIEIQKPSINDLADIFDFYLEGHFDRTTNLSFARAAIGKTGADCSVLVRRAKGVARRERRSLVASDILNAIENGAPPMSSELRRQVAVHEAGHAVIALALGVGAVRSLSITGGGGSATLERRDAVYTAQMCRDHMVLAMAGRAAEELVFGYIGSGSGGRGDSDLAIATRLATSMEVNLGLGDFGPVYIDAQLPSLLSMPGIFPTVRRHLDDAMERASLLLIENRVFLDRLSAELFRLGVLLEEDILKIASASQSTSAIRSLC